ncbi:MAG: ABC transporter ATP-binding protein [Labilithrix sp.]|nr:ABC transporter ATP-binding protein [Labilithrix sp.]
MSTAFVDVVRLCKTYSQGPLATPVLREVSMGFERGSFSAIVGPSGCGKTTLLSVLGALDAGDTGQVVVDGLDLMRASARELTEYRRRSIGFVFQFYNLLPSLTAAENVESGLEFLGLTAAARRARALDWLARVGMADLASRFPAQLSGGQQQRVAVARVLAREPKLLLADEPTGNLDEESGERIFACMKALQRESGVTCIMVTHDADLAARVDAVVRLRDGRVVEETFARSGEVPIVRPRQESGTEATLRGGRHAAAVSSLRAVGNWR